MRIHSVLPVSIEYPTVSVEKLQQVAAEGTTITQAPLPGAPAAIESERDVARAAALVAQAAADAEADGADAVIINCAAEAVRIPVVGAMQAAAATATLLTDRFSTIATEPRDLSMVGELWRRYGYAGHAASVRLCGVPVLELTHVTPETVSKLVRSALAAISDDGAGALVLACNYIREFVPAMHQALTTAGYPSIPIIDPVANAVATAESLVRQRLSHSGVTWPSAR
jgi:allantoin racemase